MADLPEEIGARKYMEAYDILGEDFIDPIQTAGVWGLRYAYRQLVDRAASFPALERLVWARDNNCIVVPGPSHELNLIKIRNLDSQLFRGRSVWFKEQNEDFAYLDMVSANWLILRKGRLPNSENIIWTEQISMLDENERVPNAPEAAWGFGTYSKVRGRHPFSSIMYLRTSSIYSGGGHVWTGYYDDNEGLVVIGARDDAQLYYTGLASAIKF